MTVEPGSHSGGVDEALDAGRLGSIQLQILELIARGLTTAEIARQVHRSKRTVESHRYQLGKKLGVSNKVALIQRAVDLGLLPASVGLGGLSRGQRSGEGHRDTYAHAAMRLVDTWFGVEPGRAGIQSALRTLEIATACQAAFLALTFPPDRWRIVESSSSYATLRGLQWSRDSLPGMESGGQPVSHWDPVQCPEELSKGVRSRIGAFARISIRPVVIDCVCRGLIGVVESADLIGVPGLEGVLSAMAARVESELRSIDTGQQLECFRAAMAAAEMAGATGFLSVDPVADRVDISPKASVVFGFAPDIRERLKLSELMQMVVPGERAGLINSLLMPATPQSFLSADAMS